MNSPRASRRWRGVLVVGAVLLGGVGVAAGWLGPWRERGADLAYDTRVDSPALTARRPRVYFDHGHHNSHSISGRFGPFASLLRADGCEVREGSSRLDARALTGVDILVIVNARGPEGHRETPAFEAGEVEAVRAWVERGGSLLLAADHHPCGPAAAGLAGAFGVTMVGGWCDDAGNALPGTADSGAIAYRRDRSMLGSHPINDGVGDATRPDVVVTFTGQSLIAPAGATALLVCGEQAIDRVPVSAATASSGGVTTTTFQTRDASAAGHCQALAMEVGAGRIVMTGEAAMLSAQRDADSGLAFGMNVAGTDNRQFVLNAIRWLARAQPPGEAPSPSPAAPAREGREASVERGGGGAVRARERGGAGDPVAAAMREVERRAAEGKIAKLTSILIAVRGATVYESYFGGAKAEDLHDTRSVGKSITALAAGVAIAEGALPGTAAKVLPLFADLEPIANAREAKSGMTIEDLLTMSSPLAADDSDASSPGNEDRMHEQRGWARWGVDLPAAGGIARDGEGRYPFRYATINAVLLGQALQRATKQPADAFIARALLTPLGITRHEFQKSPAGEAMTGGGLKLSSRDLLRIGQLVLDRGRVGERQVVPAAWVDSCLTLRRRDTVGPGIGYGYLFWNVELPRGEKTTACWFMAGNGGNVVGVMPELGGVVVITRADFNSPTTARETMGLLAQHVIPAMEAASGERR